MTAKPTVLITRPAAEAAATAARLRAAGFATVVAPLMTIVPMANAVLDLDGAQGVLMTSANGVRALAAQTARRDLAVYAVGTASAAAARDAGFATVESADGDVTALAALVASRVDPGGGRLVHIAGRVTAGGDGSGLAARLGDAGFSVERVVLYDAVAATALPADGLQALAGGRVDAVALYSPRSARLFVDLVGEAGQTGACGGVVAGCLSAAVAAVADGGGFARVVTAAHATEDALVDVLTAALQGGAQSATS